MGDATQPVATRAAPRVLSPASSMSCEDVIAIANGYLDYSEAAENSPARVFHPGGLGHNFRDDHFARRFHSASSQEDSDDHDRPIASPLSLISGVVIPAPSSVHPALSVQSLDSRCFDADCSEADSHLAQPTPGDDCWDFDMDSQMSPIPSPNNMKRPPDSPSSMVPKNLFKQQACSPAQQQELSLQEMSLVQHCLGLIRTLSPLGQQELCRLFSHPDHPPLAMGDPPQRPARQCSEKSFSSKRSLPPPATSPTPAHTDSASRVSFLVDADEYYSSLLVALTRAKSSVVFMGWVFSPMVYLSRTLPLNQATRLDNVLQAKAREGVRIRIILNVELSEACSSDGFKATPSSPGAADYLNMLHPNIQTVCVDIPQVQEVGHEKAIVIDHTICFFGSLDVSVGRYDVRDHPCTLVAGAAGRWPGREYNNPKVEGMSLSSGCEKPDPFGVKMGTVADYPRLPLHGVQAVAIGRLALSLQHHFEVRWNRLVKVRYSRTCAKAAVLGAAAVLVIAAPLSSQATFARRPPYSTASDSFSGCLGAERGHMQCTLVANSPGNPNCAMESAMVNVIQKANHYVYIESRYLLISRSSAIMQALVEKIYQKMEAGETFRVYLVLPLYPEGGLASHTNIVQLHCITDLLGAVTERMGKQSKKVLDYLCIAALQAVGRTQGGRVVTEQIHVETKLILADDRRAILGSSDIAAPCLDPTNRLAVHDIAVLMEDATSVECVMGGVKQSVSPTLRSLRLRLWKEHLLTPFEAKDAALHSEATEVLSDPSSDAAYSLWVTRATSNTMLLAEAFPYFPNPLIYRVSYTPPSRSNATPSAPPPERRDEPQARPKSAFSSQRSQGKKQGASLLRGLGVLINGAKGRDDDTKLPQRLQSTNTKPPAKPITCWNDQVLGSDEAVQALSKLKGHVVIYPFSYLCQNLLPSRGPSAGATTSASSDGPESTN